MARLAVLSLALLGVAVAQNVSCPNPLPGNIYQYSANLLDGTPVDFSSFKGQVAIVVNVASFWGETVLNYLGFNVLNATYGAKGFTVLAFPSDQFYNQEPGDNDEILNCLKYARPGGGYVPSFPIFQKTEVNGLTNVHPIFPYLKNSCPPVTPEVAVVDWIPWRPIATTDIQWNFEKFLINRQGVVVSRWGAAVDPQTMAPQIEALLAEPYP